MAVDEADVTRFGELFQKFLEQVVWAAPHETPPFFALFSEHLGANPQALPVVAEDFAQYEHTALQTAIDAHLAQHGGQLMGVLGNQKRFMALSLSDLLSIPSAVIGRPHGMRPGPVEHVNLPVGPGRTLPCLSFGLVFTRSGDDPVIALVRAGQDRGPAPGLSVEAVAPERGQAAAFLTHLRRLMSEHHPARGQVVGLSPSGGDPSRGIIVGPPGGLRIEYHERPRVPRDAIVLGPGVLDRVEAQVIGMAEQRELLRASGRHVKRGLLLHGPPGTGKTLTVRYLIGRMPDVTVVLLTGASLRFVAPSSQLARALQPALVVIEDVDLIAEERTMPGRGQMPLLFDLLNEMDGMAEDADVCFLLTTNRADLLEPALAARPGRVDLAVEIPLPDADCRRRLIDLYGAGLDLQLADPARVVERTEGVSAAFIKELLRKATLVAVARSRPTDGSAPTVTDDDLAAALDPLLSESARLTRTLLGTQASPPGRPQPVQAVPGVPDRLRWLPGVPGPPG